MRIGPFELDVAARELLGDGTRIRLQDQPFEILRALLERPGDIVTREELRTRLWPEGTFVDFEHSLNAAVKRLRAALGDDAVQPRYIETVPRRGYRLVPTAAGSTGTDRRTEPPRLTRLAVLPFADLSPARGYHAFSEGLADEVIAQVSTICRGSIAVMARRSTLAFRESNERIREIGELLGVSYLLEGSVRVEDGRVRVTARVVDAHHETLVWSEAYDRPFGNPLDLQTEVATRVAHAVGDQLSPSAAPMARVLAWPRSTSGEPPDAYRAFLKGEYYWRQLGNSGLDQALTFYAEGVQLAPTFAAAHTAMARGLVSHAEYYREVPRQALVRARESALRALELDSRQAEAHLTLAEVSRMLDFDWTGARTRYDRAIELNPAYEGAHRSFALLLSAVGEHDRARDVAAAALRCDPMCLQVGLSAAWVAYAARDYSAAIDRCLNTLDFEGRYAPARRLLGTACLLAGRHRQALDVFEAALADHPEDHTLRGWAAHANAVAGERRRAETLASELEAAPTTAYVPKFAQGLAWLGIGDLSRAFTAIEAGYEERDPAYCTIATDPRFDALRGDPRYRRLMSLARLEAMAA